MHKTAQLPEQLKAVEEAEHFCQRLLAPIHPAADLVERLLDSATVVDDAWLKLLQQELDKV